MLSKISSSSSSNAFAASFASSNFSSNRFDASSTKSSANDCSSPRRSLTVFFITAIFAISSFNSFTDWTAGLFAASNAITASRISFIRLPSSTTALSWFSSSPRNSISVSSRLSAAATKASICSIAVARSASSTLSSNALNSATVCANSDAASLAVAMRTVDVSISCVKAPISPAAFWIASVSVPSIASVAASAVPCIRLKLVSTPSTDTSAVSKPRSLRVTKASASSNIIAFLYSRHVSFGVVPFKRQSPMF